jgi:hypothetical protein
MHHGQVESGPAWRVGRDGVEAVEYGVELRVRPLPAVECESPGPALAIPKNNVPQANEVRGTISRSPYRLAGRHPRRPSLTRIGVRHTPPSHKRPFFGLTIIRVTRPRPQFEDR